ncbi:MAG: hypothetical protein NZ551_06910 [Microscillaceae bacterium]|nr:hypothetical protein [Microscillaceae bacterium]MDW8460923.1 hypothetical protein [Cytophagales bacterium]
MKRLKPLCGCLLLSFAFACNDQSKNTEQKAQEYLSQHIQFSTPKQVAQTPNYYLTIFREKKIEKIGLRLYRGNYRQAINNVVFLSKNWKIHRVLFDHQAFVHQIDVPTDSTQRNYITYIAAIKDTNQDQLVDEKDTPHLLISDLNGENLTKATPDDIEILDFEYYQQGTEILIRYKACKPSLPKNKMGVHEHERLGVFYVESKYFAPIKGLDSILNKVQTISKALVND